MRIGIDCRVLGSDATARTGIAEYTYQLVNGLLNTPGEEELVIFVEPGAQGLEEWAAAGVEVVEVTAGRMPVWGTHWDVAKQFRAANIDLLHGPANAVPLGYTDPWVVTVHDLSIYAHPEWFPRGQFISTKLSVPRSIRKARRVVAVSQYTADQIAVTFGRQDGVVVVPEGVAAPDPAVFASERLTAVRERYGLPAAPYIVQVATIEPRKNITAVVQAFEELHQAHPTLQLVLAGGDGWRNSEIHQAIQASSAREHIHVLGYVSHEDKWALLAGAQVVAFPSLDEGFGLPVLEAMLAGAPVVTSTAGALPEVAGDAALTVDPRDTSALAYALNRFVEDGTLREKSITAGRAHAAQFTWTATAQQTRDLYYAALSNS